MSFFRHPSNFEGLNASSVGFEYCSQRSQHASSSQSISGLSTSALVSRLPARSTNVCTLSLSYLNAHVSQSQAKPKSLRIPNARYDRATEEMDGSSVDEPERLGPCTEVHTPTFISRSWLKSGGSTSTVSFLRRCLMKILVAKMSGHPHTVLLYSIAPEVMGKSG